MSIFFFLFFFFGGGHLNIPDPLWDGNPGQFGATSGQFEALRKADFPSRAFRLVSDQTLMTSQFGNPVMRVWA
jgi:hypothetical protein